MIYSLRAGGGTRGIEIEIIDGVDDSIPHVVVFGVINDIDKGRADLDVGCKISEDADELSDRFAADFVRI
ncbi:hypothetical protein AGMMS50222_11140 [Endomicrobiia bacterium]|nr:hypothetical protein AGMMS50222_11140 [Endomicrobiia bacterium]